MRMDSDDAALEEVSAFWTQIESDYAASQEESASTLDIRIAVGNFDLEAGRGRAEANDDCSGERQADLDAASKIQQLREVCKKMEAEFWERKRKQDWSESGSGVKSEKLSNMGDLICSELRDMGYLASSGYEFTLGKSIEEAEMVTPELDEESLKESFSKLYDAQLDLENNLNDVEKRLNRLWLRHETLQRESILRQLAFDMEFELKLNIIRLFEPCRREEFLYRGTFDEFALEHFSYQHEMTVNDTVREKVLKDHFDGKWSLYTDFCLTMDKLKGSSRPLAIPMMYQTGEIPYEEIEEMLDAAKLESQYKMRAKDFAAWVYPTKTGSTERGVRAGRPVETISD